MVLSKALKAKLSSIPSGIANLSMPGLDRNGVEKPLPSSWALVRPPAMATTPVRIGPRWRAPFEICIYGVGVICVKLQVLSLSVEEGRFTFGVMVGIWAKFSMITKGK